MEFISTIKLDRDNILKVYNNKFIQFSHLLSPNPNDPMNEILKKCLFQTDINYQMLLSLGYSFSAYTSILKSETDRVFKSMDDINEFRLKINKDLASSQDERLKQIMDNLFAQISERYPDFRKSQKQFLLALFYNLDSSYSYYINYFTDKLCSTNLKFDLDDASDLLAHLANLVPLFGQFVGIADMLFKKLNQLDIRVESAREQLQDFNNYLSSSDKWIFSALYFKLTIENFYNIEKVTQELIDSSYSDLLQAAVEAKKQRNS